jgi:hypothetical protein
MAKRESRESPIDPKVIGRMDRWAREDPYPDLLVFIDGRKKYTIAQIVDEARRGTPLGRRLAQAYLAIEAYLAKPREHSSAQGSLNNLRSG